MKCSVHISHENFEVVANIFHEHGANGIVIEDSKDRAGYEPASADDFGEPATAHLPEEGVRINAYFPVNDQLETTIATIEQHLEKLENQGFHLREKTLSLDVVKEEDWAQAWKTYYKPIRVTKRLTIVPTWENYESEGPKEMIINLDPGMAFGTGGHATTSLCLQALENTIQSGDSVIDVGTGSGVLSIASAKLGAGHVRALDLDDTALRVATENAGINGVNDSITFLKNDLLGRAGEPADIIVANLLAHLVLSMAPTVKNHLKTNGKLIVSGIIKDQEKNVQSGLEKEGFSYEETLEKDGWVAMLFVPSM